MLDKRYHENIFQKIINGLGVLVLRFISHLPFWVLYGFSDFMYLLVGKVVKYRKKVITENLRNSFPEKTDEEIHIITKKFYRHFCDLTVETIKTYSMSGKVFEKRVLLPNYEVFNDYFKEGKSIILLAMHYNNWEWPCYLQHKVQHQNLAIYNPVRGNKALEDFMVNLRARWGSILIPVHKQGRATISFHQGEKPAILWLLADQSPHPTTKFWTSFLNQETGFFNGAEKIAQKTNQPVFISVMRKIKRGHYEVYFHELVKEPKETKEHDIMLAYARKLEETIKEAPEFYLWSHRRWKHKRPNEIPLAE